MFFTILFTTSFPSLTHQHKRTFCPNFHSFPPEAEALCINQLFFPPQNETQQYYYSSSSQGEGEAKFQNVSQFSPLLMGERNAPTNQHTLTTFGLQRGAVVEIISFFPPTNRSKGDSFPAHTTISLLLEI
uniref:(northern house mosquito) hypothetical protein n=1 Tax=Culex pipiens TaxID=7175 RepID=A0A8D8DXL1_CULPI